MASIFVGDEEVSLSTYFHVVDLWTAGHSTVKIVNTLINSQSSMQSLLSADAIANIVYNQELMQQSSMLSPNTRNSGSQDNRRLSRIASVNELDDLSVAAMVAQKKEKERLGLRQMLAKLSA